MKQKRVNSAEKTVNREACGVDTKTPKLLYSFQDKKDIKLPSIMVTQKDFSLEKIGVHHGRKWNSCPHHECFERGFYETAEAFDDILEKLLKVMNSSEQRNYEKQLDIPLETSVMSN